MKRCRDVEGAPACAGRDATSVLASGRPWCLDCGGRGGGGRVGADGGPVVCRGWRGAADQAGRAVRAVPVVRGGGGGAAGVARPHRTGGRAGGGVPWVGGGGGTRGRCRVGFSGPGTPPGPR